MRWIGLALLIATLLPGALRAQDRSDDSRTELDSRVFNRLVDQASRELGLDAGSRSKLEAALRASRERHRELAREGARLQRALVDAVRNQNTPDAEFQRILADIEALRARELEAWREEQRALAAFLTPRQRAQAALFFARVNQRLQEIRRQRQTPADSAAAAPRNRR